MKRFKIAALSIAGLIAAGLAFDYAVVRHKERLLSAAVSECGGQIGSIPMWPIGTEYRITLNRVPDEEQLQRLEIANRMRGWVGIAFQECELSDVDRATLLKMLAHCHLYVVRNRSFIPLDRNDRIADEQTHPPEPAAGPVTDGVPSPRPSGR